jgi:hypothetical protein
MEMSSRIVDAVQPDLVDINFGCPVKKVVCKGAGAGVLKDVDLMVRLTKAVIKGTSLPVTVKTRLGWDESSINIDEVAERLQDIGVQALTVHARTRAQMYKGHSDWSHIQRIKENPRIKMPIFGNGDIDSPEKALELEQQYGVIVQSCDSISDNILKGGAHHELSKGQVLKSDNYKGWSQLFNFVLPPSNSIVITDDYLFRNEEEGKIIGEGNLITFLDAVLPPKLETEYHILIITDDQERSQQRCEKLAIDLKNSITQLRKYAIVFELVFTETQHKRKAILNYLSITCDKGFAMFRLKDLMTVRDDNDFRYEKLFNRTEKHEGNSVFSSDSLILKRIKDKSQSVLEYIKNKHQDPNRRILGDCNPDKSLKNRLINDV